MLAAKGRGREMPPPVLVPSVRTVDGLATDVPAWARDLIREFWPGPLTLVFKAQSSLMWDLGETNGTVALRMPQDDIALAVLERGRADGGDQRQPHRPAARPRPSPTPPPSWGRRSRSTSTAGRPPSTEVSTILDCTGRGALVLREGGASASTSSPPCSTTEPTRPRTDRGLDRPTPSRRRPPERPSEARRRAPRDRAGRGNRVARGSHRRAAPLPGDTHER